MGKIFNETLSKVKSKLQHATIKISSQIKCVATMIKLKDESTKSKKAFYLLSLTLLISILLLSPDRVLQTLSPPHTDTGILEKTQEATKIIKKLISNLH